MGKDQKINFRGFDILAIIISVAILIISGFFGYQYFQLQKIRGGIKPPEIKIIAPSPPVSENIPTKIEPASSQIDISNWKTYRNEQYGFEVKYPHNWVMKEKEHFGGLGCGPYAEDPLAYNDFIAFRDDRWEELKISEDSIAIYILKNISKEEALSKTGFQIRNGRYFTQENIAIGSLEAQETVINGMAALVVDIPVWLYGGDKCSFIREDKGKNILFLRVDRYALIRIRGPVSNFEEVLSTFRFID